MDMPHATHRVKCESYRVSVMKVVQVLTWSASLEECMSPLAPMMVWVV